MQVLFQQFTTVWRCQKWHCLNRFYAVIKHAASNATKCIFDIPPHLFSCSYCTSQTPIHDIDDLRHRLIAAWSGCSSQSLTRSLTSGVNGCTPAWQLTDDTLSTRCDCPNVLLLFSYFICILTWQLTDIAVWFCYLWLWTLVRFLSHFYEVE